MLNRVSDWAGLAPTVVKAISINLDGSRVERAVGHPVHGSDLFFR